MNSSKKDGGYSGDEIVMILLLIVLISISLLAAYLTIRPHVEQAIPGFSSASSIRISLVTSDMNGLKHSGETAVSSVTLQEEALSPLPVIAPEVADATPDKSQADTARPLPLMDLDFSLAELPTARTRLPNSGGPLKVRKPVYVGARMIGDMEIMIVGEGQLLLDVTEVRTILEQQAGASANSSIRLPNEGTVSFATLREIGIDLRYSPTDDAIEMNPAAHLATF